VLQYGLALLRDCEEREENANDPFGDAVPRELATGAVPEGAEGEGSSDKEPAIKEGGEGEEGGSAGDDGEEGGEGEDGEEGKEGEGEGSEGEEEGGGGAKTAGKAPVEGGGGGRPRGKTPNEAKPVLLHCLSHHFSPAHL